MTGSIQGKPEVTVITPTTGRQSLLRLIETVEAQRGDVEIRHLLFWDDHRVADSPNPSTLESPPGRMSFVLPNGFGRFGAAPGSAMRAVGLLLATTTWVTFADDDVFWEVGHLRALCDATKSGNWATTFRRVWESETSALGVDRFESVGDDPCRRVPYEMCDNNCMLFRREFGVAAAPWYRETRDYNDDRLMYSLLKRNAGPRGSTGQVTVNQVCPERLIPFFRENCSPA